MIQAVILLFMIAYPIQRFMRAGFDKKARWAILGIRWAAVVAAVLSLVALAFWDRAAGGGTSTGLALSYVLMAAWYAVGEWLTRRHLAKLGIEIRETIRGANY